MKKVITCFGLFGIILCGCNNTKDKQAQEPSVSDTIIISKSDSIENFNAFFSRFKKDSAFQIERIKFPLETEYNEQSTGDVVKKRNLIKLKDWKYDSFYWDSGYAKRELDAYTQRIESLLDTTKILWEGVDNGINIELVFILVDKQWYLLKYLDYST
jgi:hypothetical protein